MEYSGEDEEYVNGDHPFEEDDEEEEGQINSKTGPVTEKKIDPKSGPLMSEPKMQVISTKDPLPQVQTANLNIIASMTVDIPSFTERKDSAGANAVFYNIVIGFQKNNKTWTIQKRYSEFDALDKYLKDIYPNMPTLPGKTLFKLSQA